MTKLNAALPKDVHVIVALIRNVDPNTGEVLGD